MSLKLIFQNIEREDYFVKIKKDYFTDKGEKKRNLHIERILLF